ncbi:MAG: hypothetical protein PHQ91_11695 [Thermoanaerobaculaceae bacterium]|nr:hypothetical protein [Thermoanaerobaculaceae bacterium]
MRVSVVCGTGAAVAALGAMFGTTVRAETRVAPATDAGSTIAVYQGPRIQVAISDQYAHYHPEGRWLLLDTEMNAVGGPINIPRSAFAVRTPGGDVVPLASQQAFEKGYPELASPIRQADFFEEHLAYFLPERHRALNLFRIHGVGWVWPSAVLDPFHNCYGRLFFQLPNGVQKGRYELLIQLEKNEVVIPFTV